MAIPISAINAITNLKFIPKLADNIATSNALVMRLKKSGRFQTLDGGQDIRQPVTYAFNQYFQWYSGSETLATANNEKKTALVFDWKQFNIPITVSGLDVLKNAGESKILDHVQTEMKIAENSIKENFSIGMYSAGTDPKSITGLRVAVATASTYGGISQSAESWLQGQVDSTTTVLSIGAIQTMWEAASEDNDSPTFLVGTKLLFNSYYAKLQPQQRFQDTETAAGGFKNLLFNGAPFVAESHVPTSHIFGLNEQYITMWSHKERNFPGHFDGFENLKIPTQDSIFSSMKWAGELIVDQPRKNFKFTALTS
jgi:hypothetical protein